MKVFWEAFIQSIQLPKRKAVFALNRIGMDVVVIYLFILLAIASIPELIEQISSNQVDSQLHTFFFLIFFFIFYYLIILIIVFSSLSVIAYLGTLFATATKRRLQFGLMWKMTAFATTIPIIAFTILSFFLPLSILFLTIATLFIFYLLLKIIFIYPKLKKQ